MDFPRRRTLRIGLFLAALTASAWSAPAALEGQEIPEVGEEKLSTFARAFLQVSATRDDFYDRFGRTHDDQGRRQLREEMDARITEILTEHGLTHAEYQRLNVVVSVDSGQRAIFERLLQEIRASEAS